MVNAYLLHSAELMISKEKSPNSYRWKEEYSVSIVSNSPSQDHYSIISIQSGNEWLTAATGRYRREGGGGGRGERGDKGERG